MPDPSLILIVADRARGRLVRAFERRGHRVRRATPATALEAASAGAEAVVLEAPRTTVLALSRRLKTRFQMPFLPVVALGTPPRLRPEEAAPDAWLAPDTKGRDVAERVEELVRIRRAEREMVRLNAALAELAAENGRLYDRARRDAEATALLLRELQHRVRNNLATIQALLVLERHRVPPRALAEALDVAIARLRSMAALQDSLRPHTTDVELGGLARAVAQGAIEVFGASSHVECEVAGTAWLPARRASAVAIVLNELITNALKHAAARHVHVDIAENAEGVALEISDDGCGMPPEHEGGSGLTIVRAVVRNELAGRLSYVNAATGTRVRITVPSDEPTQGSRNVAAPAVGSR
jgi:two-component sensor histidine kinase